MEVTLEADALKRALTAIKPAVGKNMPVLRGVRIDAGADGIRLVATDLDRTAVATMPAQVHTDGQVVINHAILTDAAAGAKGRTVKLTVETEGDQEKVVFAHRITRRMNTMPLEEFPRSTIDDDAYGFDTVIVDPVDLKRMAVAASNDDHRPVLTHLLFSPDGIAATDSYRLYVLGQGRTIGTYLVPKKVCERAAVEAKGEGLAVSFTDPRQGHPQVRMRAANGVDWFGRVFDGDFPNYKGLVPSSSASTATVEVGEFRQIVTEVGAITKGTLSPVRFQFLDGQFNVAATVEDVGDAEGQCHTAELTGNCEGLAVAFNPDFLLPITDWASEKIRLEFVDHLKPVVIRPTHRDDFLAVLMPVRVQ